MTEPVKDFLTPKDLAKDPCCPFSEKALRWYVRHKNTNGLSNAVYRVGAKIIISRAAFIEWLTSKKDRVYRKSRSK